MMSYEFWVKQLLDVMASIADLDAQSEKWPLGLAVSQWDDPYEWVDDAVETYTLELFIEMYAAILTPEQLAACKNFNLIGGSWLASVSAWPNLKDLPKNSDWISVTEAAAEFIRAFSPPPENPA